MQPFSSKEFFSREDARKYSPFFDDDYNLVYWVNASYDPDSGRRKKGSFFRHYPIKDLHYNKTNSDLSINKTTDKRHQKMQNILINIINKKIEGNEKLEWFYSDERLTDFSISGDLLKYVETVEKEYKINIGPLNLDYCLDIVLLGRKLNKTNIILGAIEIENTHEAEFLKILVCKSLGFPLLTIDIGEYSENEINEELCLKLLLETTKDNEQSRRRNYIYIHNLTLPLFIKKNDNWEFDDGHQYIIFMEHDNDIDKFKKYIKELKSILELNEKNVLFQSERINRNIDSSKTMQENDMNLLNQSHNEYFTDRYIRLVLERPEGSKNIYLFHFVLCKLLALHFNCIVGYKYRRRSTLDESKDDPIWRLKRFDKETLKWEYTRYCPKQLSEPIYMIIHEINKHSDILK
jgi:hypothetical protein